MVFNAVKDAGPFMYNDVIRGRSFKYLGMTIYRKETVQYSHHISIQQTLKSKAELVCYLNNHEHMSVKDVF